MELQLDEKESSLLARVVRNRLRDLRLEIRHTKDADVRDYLKHKEWILVGILAKLPENDTLAHQVGFTVSRT